MEQHNCGESSNENSLFIRKGIIDCFVSNASHTEACLTLLKQYLPLLPTEHINTMKLLEAMIDTCIDNHVTSIKLLEDNYNVKKRNNEKLN